uniref:Uncharacterized protein n=1 Tax=Panagrolaimus sp. ES5 TaxID=591445 RepID=A0AC34FLD8_9BILA
MSDNIPIRATSINFPNGDPVYLDKIFECVPKVTWKTYENKEFPIFGLDFINTYKEIDASKLEHFVLDMISFPYFVLFTKFMDKNPHVAFKINFIPDSLSSEETKSVEKYVQKIIDAGIQKPPTPMIEFPEQSQEQLIAIRWVAAKKCMNTSAPPLCHMFPAFRLP